MARITRHHYRRVDFLIPSFAMSAGTILVMSGNAIYMDYASVLGPIDPQVQVEGHLVPASGYLEKYEELVARSAKGQLTTAELAYLIEKFDPAELFRYEQELALSVTLLQDWLARYKFRQWKVTETRKIPVTMAMRRERAEKVAMALNKNSKWHSHSRGISMEVLRRDLKLVIDDFGEDPKLGPAVHNYYRLLKDYLIKRDHSYFAVHTKGRYVGF